MTIYTLKVAGLKSTQTAENTIKKRIEEVPTMKHLRCKDFIRLKMFCSECGLCQKINNNNSEKCALVGLNEHHEPNHTIRYQRSDIRPSPHLSLSHTHLYYIRMC